MINKLRVFIALVLVSLTVLSIGQTRPLSHTHDLRDLEAVASDRLSAGVSITTPPDFPVRTMAEWEEIQSLVIAWTSFPAILKQIAFHAKQECEVIILAQNVNGVIAYLNANNGGGAGFENLDNITIIDGDYDSIWGRDYGAHTLYRDDVDDLLLVDWIYNRNRPSDDLTPEIIAEHVGVPLYSTTEAPYDLMATGGNFMSDGMGTAFSSELIVEENSGGNTFWGTQFPNHSVAEIEDIVEEFMGIDRYVMMDALPFDGIHHIDMHMKLLDEETIIIGQYPAGVADGPQIEANIEYVLNNYDSPFGTEYDIVRVAMPPDGNSYPNTNGDYRTYTNMVFVNKTVLVPVYEEQYDTPALAIIQEQLPGYNVVGIECNDIIALSGAIHCITKAVGVADPLRIVHAPLADTDDDVNPYSVSALVQHASGISSAMLYYRVDGAAYQPLSMTSSGDDQWVADIPAQAVGSVIDYYVYGQANSGKEQLRPMVAPEGTWTFTVTGDPSSIADFAAISAAMEVYPNPASAMTVLKLDAPGQGNLEIALVDMIGREVLSLWQGEVAFGAQKIFFDASEIPAGAYTILSRLEGMPIASKPLMIK